MEKRYSMNFFLEDYRGKPKPEIKFFYLEDGDNIYGGRELLLKDRKITYYFLPIEKREALMFLYVGDDTFDKVVDSLDKYNEDGVMNAFPLFAQALINGANDNYTKTALIKLPHVNGKHSFWCFATKIENVDLSDLENDYVINKLQKLYSETIDVLNQLEENEISNWDKFKGTSRAGYDVLKIAKTALAIGGLIFGVDLSGGE